MKGYIRCYICKRSNEIDEKSSAKKEIEQLGMKKIRIDDKDAGYMCAECHNALEAYNTPIYDEKTGTMFGRINVVIGKIYYNRRINHEYPFLNVPAIFEKVKKESRRAVVIGLLDREGTNK